MSKEIKMIKYKIIEEFDDREDEILFETFNHFEAERMLCRFLNNGHDAYMTESESEQ